MSIVERALQKAQNSVKASAVAEASQEPPSNVDFQPLEMARSAPASSEVPDVDSSPTARDLKRIVHLDFDALRQVGRLAPEAMAHQIEDEFRRIKWPLLKAISARDGGVPARNNVILVTSALPGEGKTFTSLNLALSIVRDREMRVVLVDGDVAKPGLTPALGLEGAVGLIDVLENASADVSAATYRTDVDGLFFVPAGKWHEHSPEFFAGSRMPQVIEALSTRVGNGVIIVDSPPLLATNEAQAVTRYVGQVLLVVRADDTEQQGVLDAIALVDSSTPVRAVLNRVEASMASRYYGHYYYRHGYGRGYNRSGKGNAGS
jgi:exopolysaccharide/PEP-CTERM locus tyrosine autokinase